MRLDVTGRKPWPGEAPNGFRLILYGTEKPSPYGLEENEAAQYSPDGKTTVFAFGMRRLVTPPGHRARWSLTELQMSRIEVTMDGSPARLVLRLPGEELTLQLDAERRKGRLERLLEAIPLLQIPEGKRGRPIGSRQAEDREALKAKVERAADTLRSNDRRVSVRAVAGEIGYDESTLSKKLRRLEIPLPR